MRHLCDVAPEGALPYPVFSGSDATGALLSLWRRDWRQAVVIGDETTATLRGEALGAALQARGCEVLTLRFPAGERHKTRATKERLEDAMHAARIERGACVVAVGGGVVLDLAGFVAATYHRGIAHVNVATTLLAQIDAAIGGKTGVDTPHGKNLVGAFHQPRAVLLDHDALATLPEDERRNGLAEAVKHATLSDAGLFATLEAWDGHGALPSEDVIARCVAIKAEIVGKDARDRGVRNTLNFGHTVAHALEAASGHVLAHGRAVAIGLVVESRVAAALGGFPPADVERIAALLARLGLPTRPALPFSEALPYFASDKKGSGSAIRCALPSRLGEVHPVDGSYTRSVTLEALEAAWC
ncbi:MAG: 3-dehydroquinate synthase [Deltaproteobacteria bacterium]|nr:3-dehydroquinate synthase [Deltaproteobacteria bacterium]